MTPEIILLSLSAAAIAFVHTILGPCEPLIPLLMYPAASESLFGVLMMTGVFGVVTVLTMTLAVTLTALGLSAVRFRRFEHYSHAVAGSAVLVCGLSVAFLGL